MGTSSSIAFPATGQADDTISTQTLCDVAATGAVTPFLRRYVYDPDTNTVTATTTQLDGTTAYVPTGTVTACAESDTVVSTGVKAMGASATFDFKASFPGLQSISVAARVVPVSVTMTDGSAVALIVGESLTWSVEDTDDSSLATASVTTGVGGSALVAWTYKGTASGL